MKNLFNQTKKGLTVVMVLTLFVTQFSSLLFQTPKTYAVLGNFSTSETSSNQAAGAPVSGDQSVTKFIVQNTADDGDSTNVAGCLISIVSGGVADRDCTDGAGLLDPVTFPTTALQGVEFHAFTFSGYAVTSGDFDREFVLTHTGSPITGNAPSFFVSGNFFLTTQDTVPGTVDQPGTPAVAQVVSFTPGTITLLETYRMTINGIDYDYTVQRGDTYVEVVAALTPLANANPDVSCIVNGFAITCTADVPGVGFTYNAVVVDIFGPFVSLSGITPETVAHGSVYVDPGAVWSDNVDGLGVIPAATSGTVDTNTVGTYYLEYTHTDTSGNTGNTVIRTVNVTDQTAPVVTLNSGNMTIDWNGSYSELGATWTDNVDGNGNINSPTNGSVDTYTPGVYYLEYTYIDTGSNSGTAIRTVTVSNPGIPQPVDDFFSTPQDTQLDLYASPLVIDNDDMQYVVSGGMEIPPSQGTFELTGFGFIYYPNTGFVGTDTFVYRLCNILSQCGTGLATITVLDTQAPVVTLSGLSPITIAHGSVYVDSGATWTDNADGTGDALVSGLVDTGTLGTYILEYTYTDTGGNAGNTVTRTVNVTDQTAPVVTLSGLSPVAILQNTIYADAGATWTDNIDGTGFAVVSGTVDTGTVGTYYLQYSYTDTGGNISNIVTRTVNVYRPIGGAAYIVTDLPTPGSQNQTTNPETNTETSIDLNDLLNPTIDSSLCYTMNDKKIIDQGNGVSLNFMKSLQVLLNFDLTTIPGTKDYNPERSLTRAEAAKFLSLFAQNILCRETTKSYPAGLFKDLGQTDAGLQSYIKLSYEYEIFRGDVGGMFRPNDIISRDELIAVIVRLVTNEYDNAQGADRAANYKATLNSNTSIPLTSVKRGNTAEVIYDLYRNNDYSMDADLGFVLR